MSEEYQPCRELEGELRGGGTDNLKGANAARVCEVQRGVGDVGHLDNP